MTPEELRDARRRLGLTHAEAAKILETDPTTIRKMEMPTSAPSHRAPPARVARLYQCYLTGWRPDDWPVEAADRAALRARAMTDLEGVRTDGEE